MSKATHQRIITEKNTSDQKANEDGKVYKQSRKCPECKSRNVVPIQYGYIVEPVAVERIENEEIHGGGCLISEDSPKWKCRDCQNQFEKLICNKISVSYLCGNCVWL
jgi:hypothetical protein